MSSDARLGGGDGSRLITARVDLEEPGALARRTLLTHVSVDRVRRVVLSLERALARVVRHVADTGQKRNWVRARRVR